MIIQRSIWHRYGMFAVCALAVSVNLGVALVSISKLLVLMAMVAKLVVLYKNNELRYFPKFCQTSYAILLAVGWMAISWLWSEATFGEKSENLARHARLLVLPIVYFLIDTRKDALKVLASVVVTQLFVIICSWLLWLGVPIPWATPDYPAQLGIVFMSTLEQPIVSTLALVLIWFLRDEIPQKWRNSVVITSAIFIVVNVFFIMTGRSGYLTLILALSFMIIFSIPKKYQLFSIALPFILVATLFATSDRFTNKMVQVKQDVVDFQNGKIDTSQGLRLDFWMKSIEAIQEKPFVGHGVGSWALNYHRLGGFDKKAKGNPHQQFLLWFVEAGVIGFVFLLGLFVAAYRDGAGLQTAHRQGLFTVLAIIFLISLMNSPFYGAGIGEYALLLVAALLSLGKSSATPLASDIP